MATGHMRLEHHMHVNHHVMLAHGATHADGLLPWRHGVCVWRHGICLWRHCADRDAMGAAVVVGACDAIGGAWLALWRTEGMAVGDSVHAAPL